MAANVCDCGRVIQQPARGRRRSKCAVCSPPDTWRSPKKHLQAVQASPDVEPALVVATRAVLAAAGRDGTPEGIIVLTLAAQIAAGGGTAAGLASLVTRFHASKAIALSGAEAEADVIEGIFGSEGG